MVDRCPICDERLSEIDRTHVCPAIASANEAVIGTIEDISPTAAQALSAAYKRGKIEGLKEAKGVLQRRDGWVTRDYLHADIDARIALLTQEPPVMKWQPIESAPPQELLILGWQDADTWRCEIAMASAGQRFRNGYSNRWWHGRATHWLPLEALPPPPTQEGEG